MKKYYYHFTNDTLRDGRPVPPVGEWLTHKGELIPCKSGLHASEHPFDALTFAPGNTLHLVELDGEIVPHDDNKVVARKRKIVKSINAEKKLLRDFARRCALDVLKHWPNPPAIVKQYLETGDESIRAAARAAAGAAAGDAAWDAAWNAARAAARAAAGDAAWAAAGDAAWAAAWAAARAAATTRHRQWFQEMVDAEFNK